MNTDFRISLPGTTLDYFDARAAVDALQPGAWATLPYTARVHAENIVRRAEPARRDDYLRQLTERRRDLDFPWFPGVGCGSRYSWRAVSCERGARGAGLARDHYATGGPCYRRAMAARRRKDFRDALTETINLRGHSKTSVPFIMFQWPGNEQKNVYAPPLRSRAVGNTTSVAWPPPMTGVCAITRASLRGR